MIPLAENLQDLFDTIGDDMAATIRRKIPPLYWHGKHEPPDLSELEAHRTVASGDRFRVFPNQAKMIGETIAMLRKRKAGFMVADCGAGKTIMSPAAIHLVMQQRLASGRFKGDTYKVLVMCPPHLVAKWAREVEWLIPNSRALVVKRFEDICVLHRPWRRRKLAELRDAAAGGRHADKARLSKFEALVADVKDKILYVVMSENTAKLGNHVAVPCAGRRVVRLSRGDLPFVAAACPTCGELLLDGKRRVVVIDDYHENPKAKPLRCPECRRWAVKHGKPRAGKAKPHIDRFVHRQLKGVFDAVIVDEVHEGKSGTTERGNAVGTLVSCAPLALGLTGTLSGGYAWHLHALLWRVAPDIMRRAGFDLSAYSGRTSAMESNTSAFQARYGVQRFTTITERGEFDDQNAADWKSMGRGQNSKATVQEKVMPGQSPELFALMVGRACFLGLDEIAAELPPLERELIPCDPSEELRNAYRALASDLEVAVKEAAKAKRRFGGEGAPALAAQVPRILMDFLDHPWGWGTITVPEMNDDGEVVGRKAVCQPANLGEGYWDEKDGQVVAYCADEVRTGRKVAVYATSVGVRDVRLKLAEGLLEAGLRVGMLNVDRESPAADGFAALEEQYPGKLLIRRNDPTSTREAWLLRHERDMDVLITHPKRVMTGLDLIPFPTLVWYQVGFEAVVLRQASARARRPGQTQDCRVVYFYYRKTKQDDALALMGQKEKASTALEGKVDMAALDAMMNGTDHDMLTALSQALGLDARSAWTQTKSSPPVARSDGLAANGASLEVLLRLRAALTTHLGRTEN